MSTLNWSDILSSVRSAPIPTPVGGSERTRRYYATERGAAVRAAQRLKDRERDYFSRPFVGWDGEGLTTPDGIHRYVLLANSLGDHMVNENGIPSWQAFDFLLEASRQVRGIHVAFGAGYDVNMMLSDWPENAVRTLYSTGHIRRGDYHLAWRPGKSFTIRRGKDSVTLFDCLPFFQCTFDSACASYLGADYPDRAMIQENKRLRSGFLLSDLDGIIEYNRAELRNLVTLMEELRRRLNAVGLRPSRWDGPGAVAAALFKREGVKNGLAPERLANGEPQRAARFAYAGGRFEIIRWGSVAGPAYEYDVNSAYPSALRFVPCLAHGRWIHVPGGDTSGKYSVHHLRYSHGRSRIAYRVQPLFRRESNGAVCYPGNVTGWYWEPERKAATEYVARYGGTLDVLESWVWQAECDHRPFGFIDGMYAKRRALKAAGDGAHVGIKLGLNSLYGKTAQQVGWKTTPDGPRIPPYHQLEWAGFTTSWCRARVLEAAMTDIDSVIAFETDALFSMKPLPVPIGTGLGEWEATEFTELHYIQSGMYFATTSEGKVIERTRGVDRGTIHVDSVRDAMAHRLARERRISAPLTRFIGAGLALAQDFDKWRTWDRIHKDIWACPAPGGKRAHEDCQYCGKGPGSTVGVWHETFVPLMGDYHSAEYPIAWLNPDPAMNDLEELRYSHYETYDGA